MKYNYFPKTSLMVSAISLGTMMFGGQTNEADSLSIMDYAFEHGVNFWDTANVYNQGESERIVGKAMQGRREDIFLATKVNGQMGGNQLLDRGLSRRNIISGLEESLKRLGTDYIDLYYLHAPDYQTDIEESLETMSTLVCAGKIRYIGVSNYAAWQIADMLAICDKRGYIAPVITQNVYNPITRSADAELLPFLAAHKLGMAIYNPIAAGLLAGKYNIESEPATDTRFANQKIYRDRYWSPENFAAVDKLAKIAEDEGISLIELAFKWCAGRPSVTSIISGVSKLSQIQQNITLLDGPGLSEKALAGCDEVWSALRGGHFPYMR